MTGNDIRAIPDGPQSVDDILAVPTATKSALSGVVTVSFLVPAVSLGIHFAHHARVDEKVWLPGQLAQRELIAISPIGLGGADRRRKLAEWDLR